MSMKVLKLPATEEKTGYKKTAIYKLMRLNKFPKCIKLSGGRAVGWLEHELDAWIEKQAAARK